MSSGPPIFILGSTLIGTAGNWLLHGSMLVQAALYVRKYWKSDSGEVKFNVQVVATEFLHTIITTQVTWWLLVSSWGRPDLIPSGTWSASWRHLIDGSIAIPVQLFFAKQLLVRQPRFNLTKFLMIVVHVSGAVSLAVAISIAVLWQTKHPSRALSTIFEPELRRLVIVLQSLEVFGDILVVGGMIAWLVPHWRDQDRQTSSTWVTARRLVARAFETSALTLIIVSVSLGLNIAGSADKPYNLVLIPLTPKIYANVLLYNLNSRKLTTSVRPSRPPSLSFFTAASRRASRVVEEGVVELKRSRSPPQIVDSDFTMGFPKKKFFSTQDQSQPDSIHDSAIAV